MNYTNQTQHTSARVLSTQRRVRFLSGLAALLALAALAATASPGASAAITDAEELTRFGSKGSGAGQLNSPDGIATDPVTGHVYIADRNNNRISEFTPWGNFVKAFGWDVDPGAVNEQQEVRVRAAAGQFKLSFGAAPPTPDLAFDAPGSASEGPGSVEAALNALPSIDDAGGSVSVSAIPGTPDGLAPYIYVIAFKGSLAGTDVAQITATPGTTPLSGGVPTNTLEARTRAEGTAGGTGLESCTAESGCKAGLQGPGAGEFSGAQGIAADAAGNIYVREIAILGGNDRVQKFDPAGRFLLMLGGEVNQTTKENICTVAQLEGGDECGIGTVGNGQGQFDTGNSDGIAFTSGGALFVADVERIQRFNSAGEYQASVPVSETIHALAVAPGSGDFYATVGPPSGTKENVRKLNAITGEETGVLEATETQGTKATGGPIAIDPAGDIFARRANVFNAPVLEFDSEGKQTSEFAAAETGFSISAVGTNAIGDVYVAYGSQSDNFIRLFGPGPVSFEAAPRVPPTIVAQFAGSVGRDDATVAAEINPHFWSNTRYYVQYGTGKCSEGGCEETKPLPPGALLGSKTVDAPLKSAGILLEGLQPGTTYHYRFVAQSSGGGPVRGIGGEVGDDGEESTFTTYPVPAPPKTDCPNQVFRIGFSAPLPDCRAFEMVSPIDKNNGDIKALLGPSGSYTNLDQSSTDGERFTYSSYRAFADPKAAVYTNQYFANRDPQSGWSSEAISQPLNAQLSNTSFENLYKVFSPDLCTGWLMMTAEPVLAPGASKGYPNLYRRDNCGGEDYEALIQVKPTVNDYHPELQGVSADGKEAVFMVKDKLTEDAASEKWQAYYASQGKLHLLCIGPNGLPSDSYCSVGTSYFESGANIFELERASSVSHAISVDGSKVYWTDRGAIPQLGKGKVYLRLNPDQEQSAIGGGECTEAEKACTVKVSETVSSKPARFLGASADGSRALFEIVEGASNSSQGPIYLFDLESASSTLIAAKGLGVAGMSEDLSHVYFVSEEALPETSGATAGKRNLYLDQEGTKTFIATLSIDDQANIDRQPISHVARATADGSRLAFVSTESLTGYDNTDQATGEADSEVYLYEAGSAGPVCISCNPSGARPRGGQVIYGPQVGTAGSPTAGALAPSQYILNSPRVLSSDGKRLFFNSFDALLPRDTNGKVDVYEWEAASGAKECEERGAELYVPSSGGCLSLISSGQSPSDSEFLDASSSGGDVFFTTSSSLLPQDPGLIDVYDAREGGGLPAPPAPPGPCQGEACQFAPPPPNDPTPASASFKGAGNPSAKPRCRKGKVARKGRCVAKKRKHAKKRQHRRNASHNRGAHR